MPSTTYGTCGLIQDEICRFGLIMIVDVWNRLPFGVALQIPGLGPYTAGAALTPTFSDPTDRCDLMPRAIRARRVLRSITLALWCMIIHRVSQASGRGSRIIASGLSIMQASFLIDPPCRCRWDWPKLSSTTGVSANTRSHRCRSIAYTEVLSSFSNSVKTLRSKAGR